ncbi:hypothetical protein G6F63_016628 [Rhizopus arrhizus]|nr:hypothetical protein G6F63_016628 [Rhizopus arrhizus]
MSWRCPRRRPAVSTLSRTAKRRSAPSWAPSPTGLAWARHSPGLPPTRSRAGARTWAPTPWVPTAASAPTRRARNWAGRRSTPACSTGSSASCGSEPPSDRL